MWVEIPLTPFLPCIGRRVQIRVWKRLFLNLRRVSKLLLVQCLILEEMSLSNQIGLTDGVLLPDKGGIRVSWVAIPVLGLLIWVWADVSVIAGNIWRIAVFGIGVDLLARFPGKIPGSFPIIAVEFGREWLTRRLAPDHFRGPAIAIIIGQILSVGCEPEIGIRLYMVPVFESVESVGVIVV